MRELFTVGQILNSTVLIFNDFDLQQVYCMLEQWHGIHGVISITILIWTKIITLGYGERSSSKSC